MPYTLGVDLGTTWSAAAVADGGKAVPLPLSQPGPAIPSVVARDGDAFVVGEAAEQRLRSHPSSGAREVKRRLGDPAPFVLDGAPFGAEALLAQVLAHAIATATEVRGEAPESVVLSHPANWGEYKLDLLRETARLAGVNDVQLVSEPEAAALHHAASGKVAPGDAVAVYDFGGGTFDAAVVRCGPEGTVELLGEPQGLERLGGIDLDHAVLSHVGQSLDGRLMELDRGDPAVMAGLNRLREACTAAKEVLSSDSDATIAVDVPGITTQVRITRSEMEAMIRPRLADTLRSLRAAVSSAGLELDGISAILLVGGTSRIPLVAEVVTSETGRPVVADENPKLVVALGASTLPAVTGRLGGEEAAPGPEHTVLVAVVDSESSSDAAAVPAGVAGGQVAAGAVVSGRKGRAAKKEAAREEAAAKEVATKEAAAKAAKEPAATKEAAAATAKTSKDAAAKEAAAGKDGAAAAAAGSTTTAPTAKATKGADGAGAGGGGAPTTAAPAAAGASDGGGGGLGLVAAAAVGTAGVAGTAAYAMQDRGGGDDEESAGADDGDTESGEASDRSDADGATESGSESGSASASETAAAASGAAGMDAFDAVAPGQTLARDAGAPGGSQGGGPDVGTISAGAAGAVDGGGGGGRDAGVTIAEAAGAQRGGGHDAPETAARHVEVPAPPDPAEQLADFQEAMRDRLEAWPAPEGADPERVAELRADLEERIASVRPEPGQSVEDLIEDATIDLNQRIRTFVSEERGEDIADRTFLDVQADRSDVNEYQDDLEDYIDTFATKWGVSQESVAGLKAQLDAIPQLTSASTTSVRDEQLAMERLVQTELTTMRTNMIEGQRAIGLHALEIQSIELPFVGSMIDPAEAMARRQAIEETYTAQNAEPLVPPEAEAALHENLDGGPPRPGDLGPAPDPATAEPTPAADEPPDAPDTPAAPAGDDAPPTDAAAAPDAQADAAAPIADAFDDEPMPAARGSVTMGAVEADSLPDDLDDALGVAQVHAEVASLAPTATVATPAAAAEPVPSLVQDDVSSFDDEAIQPAVDATADDPAALLPEPEPDDADRGFDDADELADDGMAMDDDLSG